jgi:ribosomal protein S27AE
MLKHSEQQKRYKNSKKGRITQEKYYHSEAKRLASRRWWLKNRFKHKIQNFTKYAIKIGKLSKKNCEICGNENSMAHHDDYFKPLEVRWLCNYHHTEWHRKFGEGKNGR